MATSFSKTIQNTNGEVYALAKDFSKTTFTIKQTSAGPTSGTTISDVIAAKIVSSNSGSSQIDPYADIEVIYADGSKQTVKLTGIKGMSPTAVEVSIIPSGNGRGYVVGGAYPVYASPTTVSSVRIGAGANGNLVFAL